MRHARLSGSPAGERVAPVAATFFRLPERAPEAGQPPLGTRARRLLRRIVLADHSVEGLIRMVDQLAIRPALSVLRIVPLIIRVGAKARRDCGVPIRRQIAGLLRMVLVHGSKPNVYYLMECYRDEVMREAGAILHRNEIKHGVGKALNLIDAEARKHRRNLGDKLEAAKWCAEAGLPHPQPLMLVERGDAVLQGGSMADLDRDLFVKRRDSRGAKAVGSYRRTGPFQYLDNRHRAMSLAQIIAELVRRTPRESLLVLPLLRTHPELADLTGDSLLTFRAITCLDEQLRPVLTNGYLRSMVKLEPRWKVGWLEELAAPVDLETGALGRMTGDKPPCLSEWFDRHPVTGAMVTGRIVPFWPELARLAVRAHNALAGRVWIGWDIAVTEEGPVLLEGNSFADPLYPQRVYRAPFGHMRLGELLSFHLGRIEAEPDLKRLI